MKFTNNSTIEKYTPEQQGSGAFDGGKITEIKPIDFPGGTSQSKRIGPLFYWAWASANGDGVIGMHPHQAFEIMSYVIQGEIGHSDSGGNKSRVGECGAQVMQTGSGIYHQEEMFGDRTDFFQIWFEPYLRESIRKQPTYNEYGHEDFFIKEENGATVKSILGSESQIMLDAEVAMDDVTVKAGHAYSINIRAGYGLAVMTIAGAGAWKNSENDTECEIDKRDFVVIRASENETISVEAANQADLRLAILEVPLKVDYPLYGE